jgi:hypothetical protein
MRSWSYGRRASRERRTLPPVAPLDDFDALFNEPRRCGERDADVERERVWMMCRLCDAMIVRLDNEEKG